MKKGGWYIKSAPPFSVAIIQTHIQSISTHVIHTHTHIYIHTIHIAPKPDQYKISISQQ